MVFPVIYNNLNWKLSDFLKFLFLLSILPWCFNLLVIWKNVSFQYNHKKNIQNLILVKFKKEYHPHLKICPSEIIFISFFVRSRKRKKKRHWCLQCKDEGSWWSIFFSSEGQGWERKKRIAKKKISKGIGILMKRTIFLDWLIDCFFLYSVVKKAWEAEGEIIKNTNGIENVLKE